MQWTWIWEIDPRREPRVETEPDHGSEAEGKDAEEYLGVGQDHFSLHQQQGHDQPGHFHGSDHGRN